MIRRIVKYVLVFLLMMITFCITLTVSSLIPKKYIEGNVRETAEILNEESNKLMIIIPSKRLYLMFDNFTDALMINTVYSIDTDTPFYSAMVARKNYIKGVTKTIYPDTNRSIKVIIKIY